MERNVRIRIPSLANATEFTAEGGVRFDKNGVADTTEEILACLQHHQGLVVLDRPEPEPEPVYCEFPRCAELATSKVCNPSKGTNSPTVYVCDAHEDRVVEDGDSVVRLPGAPPKSEPQSKPNESAPAGSAESEADEVEIIVEDGRISARLGDKSVCIDRAEGASGELTDAEREAALAEWKQTYESSDTEQAGGPTDQTGQQTEPKTEKKTARGGKPKSE